MTRNELTKLWAKVTGKFDALIAGAPEALDTLKEIADKLNDDDDALAGLLSEVAGKADAPLVISGINLPNGYEITKRDFDAAITAHNAHRQVYLAEGFNVILIGVYLDAQYKYLLFCGASYDGSPFASVYKYNRDDSTLTDDSRIAGESFDLQKKLTFDSVPTSGSGKLLSSGSVYTALQGKQDTLESGTNIKTVNGNSLLGSGNVEIGGGFAEYPGYVSDFLDGSSVQADGYAALQDAVTNNTPFLVTTDGIVIYAWLESGAMHIAGFGDPNDEKKISGFFESTLSTTPVGGVYDVDSVSAFNSDWVTSQLAGKQNTISDLATIRSGAALGATAVQPAALSGKQDVSPITNAASGALVVNEYRDFGTVSALTVTLSGGTMANYYLYKFAFTCASDSTTLTLPSGIKLPVDMEMVMATGRRFECTIDYANCLTFNCWD